MLAKLIEPANRDTACHALRGITQARQGDAV